MAKKQRNQPSEKIKDAMRIGVTIPTDIPTAFEVAGDYMEGWLNRYTNDLYKASQEQEWAEGADFNGPPHLSRAAINELVRLVIGNYLQQSVERGYVMVPALSRGEDSGK